MDIKRLLSYGYLFKELPPCFTSVSFGENYERITGLNFETNKCIEFSIPKGQYSRRLLSLPHPSNYIQLSRHLCETRNWSILKRHYSKSRFSHSQVIENEKAGQYVLSKSNRAIKTNYDRLDNSKEKIIIDSFDMLYELQLDISKFYPSIYSHSFVWALLGKDRAKQLWRLKKSKTTEPDFPIYDFGDKLDNYTRYAQDNQSVGIPIGPDTSHILSEIIAVYLDDLLESEFPKVKAFRYFDDYNIYLETEEMAQKVLKYLQQVLADLQLSINESKLKVQKFPFAFQNQWIKEIHDVSFTKLNTSNIKQYFSVLFGLAKQNPEKSGTIFSYALRTFEKRSTEIDEKRWLVFESLLLKSILIEPSILEIASRIFETYRRFVSTDKLETTLRRLLEYHSDFNHHYETLWALWIYKQFKLELSSSFVEKLIDSADNFSILMLLDLNNHGYIADDGLTSDQLEEIKDLIELEGPTDWLLYYEAVEVKKWIAAAKRPGYESLSVAGITFFDSNAAIKTFDIPRNE
ncbi:RNA-directed DNA polymerase [Fulvivirga sediminis]|uniref:RNA-directed DNA polymerase n=1 Tax=Fulvivirga sediminis TaxID=2803949 RepID=A0A937K0K3_9BACT|nr:RNA-directed DNA polymerase [Fulvivirga sediminis]MBL3658448.1 RNA-directed DNA polymerase [Fulvivirga sediminis]